MSTRFIDASKKRLEAEVTLELSRSRGVLLPVMIDVPSALCVIASLQLALRHPANTGPSAKIAREFIDGLIAARLGDDTDYDDVRTR